MKLYSNKFNPAMNLKSGSILVYGNDYGLVKEIEKKIISYLLPTADGSIDEMAVKQMQPEDIKDDPSILLDEISSVSFFADKKLTRIADAPDSIFQTIEEALPETSLENFLLLTAGELKPTSKLRKLYESSSDLLAVLCYKDDDVSIKSLLRGKLQQAGISADNDTIEFLASNLGEDRLITSSEIDKIITFVGSAKQLSFEEATQILADSSQITLTELAFALSARDSTKAEKSLARVFSQQIAAVAILRAVAWHFQRLLRVKVVVETSPNVDAAVKSLRPQVFFRQIPQFKMDVNRWNKRQLTDVLNLISQAELASKKGSIDEQIICRDTLLKLLRV